MTYLSISEMAKYNNVSIQTLRFYDKEGIFKPDYVNPGNRYRYYSVSQVCDLDIIKYLRHIGASLDEIRDVVNLAPAQMCEFLDKQESIIDEQIRKLQDTKRLLAHHKSQIGEQARLLKQELGTVYIRRITERAILKADCNSTVTPFDQHKLNFRGLSYALEEEGSVMAPLCGCIYPLKDYSSTEDIHYSSLYTAITKTPLTSLPPNLIVDSIPEGSFMCIAFKWSKAEYYEYFCRLKKAYEESGGPREVNVYEFSLPNNYASSKEEDFITELQIPIM